MRNRFLIIILMGGGISTQAQTNNNFPVTGSATIYDYSPLIYLKRNTNDGGFIQGIQTQLLDGTNNWFFGALHEGKWAVSKGDYQNEILTVANNGNVGIGIREPSTKLDVNGGINATSYYLKNTGASDYPGSYLHRLRAEDGNFYIDGDIGSSTFTPAVTVHRHGNVSIGSTDSKGYKLAVNGKIRAQEIKVEASPWPDYVFTKDYQLPTLQQTEQHIKEKGHLPGIPSAAEVKASGIDVGEMNAKLLQKIEELTLHLIEKDKEIKSIKSDYQELRKMISDIKSKN